MGSVFSAISGHFTRSLVLGTILPVLVFLILGLLIVAPNIPSDTPWTAVLTALDPQWQITAFAIVVVIVSGLLYNLNEPITRLYEGYPWLQSRLGKRLTETRSRQLIRITDSVDHLRLVRDGLRRSPGFSDEIKKLTDLATRLDLIRHSQFPGEPRLVLPTRLGNAIRSFEDYSRTQYAMDAIPLWTRIVPLVPKEHAEVIGDAKTGFDFFLNCSVLSYALTFELLVVGVWQITLWPDAWSIAAWASWALLFLVLARLSYEAAINRATAWGAEVRAVFDLYRSKLLTTLGFSGKVVIHEQERQIWRAISLQMLLGDPPKQPPAAYVVPQTIVRGEPGNTELKFSRSTLRLKDGEILEITARIPNNTSQAFTRVRFFEVIPDGYAYLASSAGLETDTWTALEVRDDAGIEVQLPSLAAGAAHTLKYRFVRITSGGPKKSEAAA